MSKGLEALENIIETFYDKESEDIQIVRKELKALEFLKSGSWIVEEDFSKTSCFVFGKFVKESYDLLKELLK